MSTSLDAAFAKRLERLALRIRRAFAGKMQGERRSTKRGASVEFADYREYVPGDDPRYLDWNAAARMDRLYLKLYVEEEDLSVHFLVDASASMDFGQPSKLDFAKGVAAALAYVSLSNLDRVSIRAFAAGRADCAGPERGKSRFPTLLQFLDAVGSSGTSTLGSATREFLATSPRRGPVFVISDLLDPAGYEIPLAMLEHSGFQPMIIHVLAPEELTAPAGDDLRFVDSESGNSVEVSLTRGAAKAYEARVAAFRHDAEGWCRRHDMAYAFASSADDLEEFVLRSLRVLMLQS